MREINLSFATETFTLLVGSPDSGHELLLRVIGLLDAPDRGEIQVAGIDAHGLAEDERARLRDQQLGFVFAAPFLLPAFSPIENVAMPLFRIGDAETDAAQQRAEALLDFTGLPELLQAPCSELSALDQHRVALARALVNEPVALLIEQLDGALAGDDLSAFAAIARGAATRFGIAVIATASPAFPSRSSDRVIEIADGEVRADSELLPRSDA